MKSASIRSARTLLFASVAVSGLALNSCGKSRHETSEVYDLVAANTRIDYWQEAAAGLSAAAKDLSVRAEMVGPETYDPQAEKEALMTLVRQKVPPAGILVSCADPEIMRLAIDAAADAGIPVITIDADSPKSKRLLFIGTNNYQAGQVGGELLVRELKGKGTVALYSIPGQENLDERLEGYKRPIAAAGIKILQVVDMHGNASNAFDATNAFLNGKNAPDAFVCLEALSCSEVADVLDRSHVQGKLIIAMDTNDATLEWIRKGMIRATIAQKPYTMAYYGLRVADDLHHNKAVSLAGSRASVPAFIDTGSTLVDNSNVGYFRAAAH